MDSAFWHRKWELGQTGFHEPAPNRLLTETIAALDLAPGAHVFVPLCGKTLDIGWLLQQGYRVSGIELNPLAIASLFEALALSPHTEERGALRCVHAPGLRIFEGDIFALDRDGLGAVDAVYDRAALIALPQEMRRRYVAHLTAMTDSAPQLLVTMEYDQARLEGPPFSVSETEVAEHYAAAYRLDRLEARVIEGGFKGVPARETVWHLRPRLPD